MDIASHGLNRIRLLGLRGHTVGAGYDAPKCDLPSESKAKRPLVAVLPFKGTEGAKSRLSSVLSPAERSDLALWMLKKAVMALEGNVEETVIVTGEGQGAAIYGVMGDLRLRAGGSLRVMEAEGSGLNAHLEYAVSKLGRHFEESAESSIPGFLIILPDLPLFDRECAERLASAVRRNADGRALICPDRRLRGTNALYIPPGWRVRFRFGEGSFQEHLREVGICAASHNGGYVVLFMPEVSFDLDEPGDYFRMLGALAPFDDASEEGASVGGLAALRGLPRRVCNDFNSNGVGRNTCL